MRSDERVPFNQPVSFNVNVTENGGTRKHGFAVNISFGGLELTADYRFEEGEILEIHLPIGATQKALPVRAEVVWVDFSKSQMRAGLRFLL
jgi:hypothetical protein